MDVAGKDGELYTGIGRLYNTNPTDDQGGTGYMDVAGKDGELDTNPTYDLATTAGYVDVAGKDGELDTNPANDLATRGSALYDLAIPAEYGGFDEDV